MSSATPRPTHADGLVPCYHHIFHLYFETSQRGEGLRFLPKSIGSGRAQRCVGGRTGESCFSGCVRAAHGLNVSFVVLSVKACV